MIHHVDPPAAGQRLGQVAVGFIQAAHGLSSLSTTGRAQRRAQQPVGADVVAFDGVTSAGRLVRQLQRAAGGGMGLRTWRTGASGCGLSPVPSAARPGHGRPRSTPCDLHFLLLLKQPQCRSPAPAPPPPTRPGRPAAGPAPGGRPPPRYSSPISRHRAMRRRRLASAAASAPMAICCVGQVPQADGEVLLVAPLLSRSALLPQTAAPPGPAGR